MKDTKQLKKEAEQIWERCRSGSCVNCPHYEFDICKENVYSLKAEDVFLPYELSLKEYTEHYILNENGIFK